MTSNFRASPLPSSSSALSSSLSFVARARPLYSPRRHPRLLYRGCHLSFCRCPSRRSFLKGGLVHSSDGGRNRRRFSSVCESYGRENAETSDLRYSLNSEGPPSARIYDTAELSKRGSWGSGKEYGRSETFERSPRSPRRDYGRDHLPGKHFQGAERFSRNLPAFNGNRDGATFNRESPATGAYGTPRRFVREYPARIDRLQEVVSRNHGSVQSFDRVSSIEDASGVRAPFVSPFRNSVVSVFWDLDNKPPTTSPYEAALFLRHAASQFGSVINMVAYANYHAFTYVPEWVREQRRDRKELDILEKKGIVQPDKPYLCELCGRRCKTNLLLKKHFKQLHEREHNKRMNRLNSLKGKKKDKYRASVLPKTQRYKEAASPILVPRVGYGLESDLRRAGVFVKTVQFKPQAADIELKKQVANSIQKGAKCICLVSDDAGFSTMLADARALNLRTIVFGDSKSLKRYADFWFPWEDVLQGIPTEDFQEAIHSWTLYHDQARQRDLKILAGLQQNDSEVEHKIFGASSPILRPGFSAFSEEEANMEPNVEQVGYVSASDDSEWSFEDEDEDDEADGGWESHVDDSELG